MGLYDYYIDFPQKTKWLLYWSCTHNKCDCDIFHIVQVFCQYLSYFF